MKTWSMRPGSIVSVKGQSYRVRHVLDLRNLLAERVEDGTCETISVADAQAPPFLERVQQLPLDLIDDAAWREAYRRYEVIRPLIEDPRGMTTVGGRALQTGCSKATIHRYRSRYAGHASSLLPIRNTGGREKNRLPDAVEDVIAQTLQDYYLTPQRRSSKATIEEAQRRCQHAKLPVPSRNTVLKRIAMIPAAIAAKSRGERRQLRQELTPRVGSFKEAEYPLSVVQMDFSPIDMIVVDPLDRRAAGRPWLTIATDVNTRVVLGILVSLEEPGAESAGICLARCMLPKEQYLRDLGVDASWPVWGIPRMLHVDNGKQFRSTMLERACKEYGITLNYRPVARPHYGAHIERLIGTTMKNLHELPGSTFSSVHERRDYDSAKHAALTLREVEQWLVTWITGVYHQSPHSSLGVAPIAAFERGLKTNEYRAGPELPERIYDEEKLKLDFLPYFERSVLRRAIVVDSIRYWDPVLAPFLTQPKRFGKRPQYTFRRDPVDISRIWFWNPELNKYQVIPYLDVTWPPMSIWELRAIKRRLTESKVAIDETTILRAWEELRQIEQRATEETRERRRSRQRRATVVKPAKTLDDDAGSIEIDEIESLVEVEVNFRNAKRSAIL